MAIPRLGRERRSFLYILSGEVKVLCRFFGRLGNLLNQKQKGGFWRGLLPRITRIARMGFEIFSYPCYP
jgi:hypothetical protein